MQQDHDRGWHLRLHSKACRVVGRNKDRERHCATGHKKELLRKEPGPERTLDGEAFIASLIVIRRGIKSDRKGSWVREA